MARVVITHPCSNRSSPAYLVLVQGICGNAHATEFTERRSVVLLEVLLLLSNGNGIYRTGPCVCDSEPRVSGTLVMKDSVCVVCHVSVHMCESVCASVYLCVRLCAPHVCLYVCLCVSCVYLRMCVHVFCVCESVCKSVCLCVSVCV